MTIVICTKQQKDELIEQNADLAINNALIWTETINNDMAAAACIDFLFENAAERINTLNNIAPLIIINHVAGSTAQLPPSFIRINAWPGFAQNTIIEAACKQDDARKSDAESLLAIFNKKIFWAPDLPGFITARTIAMIINEAYLTLQEGVSTKKEIDTAMKSGTNYPYGPFEWAAKIGIKKVYELLCAMAATNSRYSPCHSLTNEALLQ